LTRVWSEKVTSSPNLGNGGGGVGDAHAVTMVRATAPTGGSRLRARSGSPGPTARDAFGSTSPSLVSTGIYVNLCLNSAVDVQLRALSDPTRLEILRTLLRGERQAGEIAAAFPVSRPAISHHLRVLSDAGLVRMRKRAQSRLYSVDAEAVLALRSRFDRFWDDALPRLKAVVESEEEARRRRRSR
jgi:DNA-binding transcriptional ArsR family regulator